MGWAIGTGNGGRDIGYGVPAICDQPGCDEEIDRGISYACGNFRSDSGCGQYFCSKHLNYFYYDIKDVSMNESDHTDDGIEFCDHCLYGLEHPDAAAKDPKWPPYHEPKPDILKWVLWKLYDASWERWRQETPKELATLKAREQRADKREVRRILKEIKPEMEQNQ